jgi:GNAT superfamily N-acetyltransferase
MELVYTNGSDERFIELCHELDNFLNDIVGGEKQRAKYDQYNKLIDIHDVVLVVENGQAVGCGSYKRYNAEVAEIKRVFIRESHRGKGFSKQIMYALEQKAKENGYIKLILETGNLLKAAMNLYLDSGYVIIENYGQYINMPESICMMKEI